MKVLVIGSGLLGVASAYFLRRRGYEVTVIERQDGPGRETSFANGALLTPSMAEPWNAPGCWRVLFGSLGRSDAALQLRVRALPDLVGWGLAFLRNSRTDIFERNTQSNLRLAQYSLRTSNSLRQQVSIEYHQAARGSLRIFRDLSALDQAFTLANRRFYGKLSFRKLSTEEALELEPALEPIAGRVRGALYYNSDESGDAYRFCTALANHARQQGVHFHFGNEVSSLEIRAGRVTSAVIGRERLVADKYIVAAGSYSAPLLRQVGVQLPIRPVKGYSVTFGANRSKPFLRIPVIDDDLHAVAVPLDGFIRVAGTAEFAGYDLTIPSRRITNLLNLLRDLFPREQFDPTSCRPWCGLRPVTVDGVPIIGMTTLSNLFVNTGHGHLGWTMAVGSAQLLSDLVCGDSPAIDPAPYNVARFNSP